MADPRTAIATLYEHRMELLTQRLRRGEIDLQDWHIQMRQEVRDAFALQLRAGAGDGATIDDYLQLGAQVRSQDSYLEDFAHAIKAGDLSDDAITARAKLYAKSSQQMYWRTATGAADLPAYPGDGSTRCLSNCQCTVNVERDADGNTLAYWRLGGSDHCEDCVQRSIEWNPLVIRAGG